ncbi:recombinase family protein [Desulfotomaculum nigrificans]|uniref:recombinase family protein n=1 Tax=Desulfotomaculum nigrificans TaxID=1565 RepID=UPI0001FAED02|nr:recombinase family protein [Desulfotomaculum nigrificans]
MERVLMHLRKSRADLEAEARGEGETLAKHRNILLKLAKERNLNIVKIREEVGISGESLIHRPEMLETLKEVEEGLYDAVLCMDIDRLGRGNTKEQGIILEAFKNSNTKIITPLKTYDLNNEFDEEYAEFGAFMARREFKFITRRLQRGRVATVEEGNYIAPRPPYGYIIEKNNKERYLIPHPEQAPIVKMIFDWYTHDDPNVRMGASKIANELNKFCKSPTGIAWKGSTVLSILKNAVYAGRIQWRKKEEKKSITPGKKKDVRMRPKEQWIDVEGKHEPLVSMETYLKAQEILERKYHVPYQIQNGITNPLAGLVKCGICGSSMVYRPYTHQRHPHLICYNRYCTNKSSRFEYVESKIIQGLHQLLAQYKADWFKHQRPKVNDDSVDLRQKALHRLEKELNDLYKQKDNLHNLLEKGVYSIDTFLERSNILAERIDDTKKAIHDAEKALAEEVQRNKVKKDIIPTVENVLELYYKTQDPAKKNNLLKSVLDYAVYRKEKHQRDDDFTLVLYPKLPQINS